MKIAIVVHLFYDDLAEEFVQYLKNIPVDFDLYVSTHLKAKKRLKNLFSNTFPSKKVDVKAVPNRGMDIAPFVIEFEDVYDKYNLVCKVHGKKSSYALSMRGWRNYLLYNLLGSKKIVKTILNYFETDKKLGIVFPEKYDKIIRKDLWQGNWGNCLQLAKRLNLNLSLNQNFEFPTGSMFWFRPRALKPLFDLGLNYNDFESAAKRRDGTLAHAIERLFTIIVEKQGYKFKKVLFKPIKSNQTVLFSQEKIQEKIIEKYLLLKKHLIYRLPPSWQKKIFRWGYVVLEKSGVLRILNK